MKGLRTGMLSLFFLPLLLSYSDLPVHAATTVRESTSKAIEAKIALESSLERRLRSLLTEVLGSEDVLVIINADLRTEQEEKEAAEEVMPGVPAKENPAIPGALGASLTMVKRIQATIIVDKSTGESDVQLIRKVTGGLLGIAPNKQDSVIIEKMAFRKVKPLSAADFLTPQQLWKLPWLLTLLTALGLLYAGFLRPFLGVGRQMAEILRSQAQNGQMPASKAETSTAAAAAPGLAPAQTNGVHKSVTEAERPFSFIREEHLPKLAYLMRRGTPEHLAMVIHYLPPHIASRFLESQSDGVRARVAQYLADVTELEEAAVREVEKWIKTRIDFLVGGEEKLAEIIEGIPSEKQEEFLSKIAAKDPLIRTRLERRLVRIEDVAGLETAELQALLRKVPMQTVAQVLKARQDLADQILPKLSANIAERLREEMALARDIPEDRLRAETSRIVRALKEMVQQGAVVLTRGLPGSPEPGAAPKTSEG